MKRIVLTLSLTLFCVMSASAETLDDAWHIATRVSHQLRAQCHTVEAAKAQHDAAKAARNPVLSNRSAYVALSDQPEYTIRTPEIDLSSVIPTLPTIPSFGYNMPLTDRNFAMSATTVTVPLYTGGKIKSAVDASRHQVRAAGAGYSASFQELKLEVAESYFNVLRSRQLLNVTRDAEKSLHRHQKDVEKLLQQKMVTRNALLAAQAAWAAAAQDVIKVDNLVLIAESSYNRYMGRPLDYPVQLEELPVPPTCGDLNVLTGEAMRYRKELVQVASQSQASAALSRGARADRLPQVVATGGHVYVQNSHLSQESYWTGAVGLQWTPLDGGASRARERAALQTAAAAARMREETRSLIELQVRSAWTTELETRSRIEVAQLGKRQADENLRVVTRQFQEGLVNHTEVLDAQTQQTAAAMNLCHATYDAIVATYRLKRAIGLLY